MFFFVASASGAGTSAFNDRSDTRPVVNVAGELKMAAGENSTKTPGKPPEPSQPASTPKILLSIPTSFGDVVQIVKVEDKDGEAEGEVRYKSSRVKVLLSEEDDIWIEALLRIGPQELIILSTPSSVRSMPNNYVALLLNAERVADIGGEDFGTVDDTFNFQKVGDEVRFDLGYQERRKKNAIYRDGKISLRLETLPPTATLPKDACAEVLRNAAECAKIEADCNNVSIDEYFPMSVQRYFTWLENAPVFSTDKFNEVCKQFCTSKTYSVKAARLPLCGY